MKRRDFLRRGIAGAALPILSSHSATSAAPKRLNVLFLMDDQHRGDCLHAAGATWLDTPNLDRLAREGVRFTKAYTSLPSCYPARASLLTGMSPWGHGVLLYAPLAPRYPHEMPRTFTEAGYRTHAVGKMHFDSNDHGFETILLEEAWRAVNDERVKCDYRKWFEANYPDKDVDATGLGYTDHRGGRSYPYDDAIHPTYWTAQQAVEFLDEYDGERPWFLKVSFQRHTRPSIRQDDCSIAICNATSLTPGWVRGLKPRTARSPAAWKTPPTRRAATTRPRKYDRRGRPILRR